ncbi:MAG: metalloregulator ArsR/SmtB family transcription factor [Candidatus Acidiferrum sp.]
MVNYSPHLDSTFSALSDPTRRALLARLALGEATVSELAEPFDVSLPAISKHLRVLESAGLLRRNVEGRVHRCTLASEPMKEAAGWIEHYRVFWDSQLDALGKFLEGTQKESHPCQPRRPLTKARNSSSGSAAPSPRRAKGSSLRGPDANS